MAALLIINQVIKVRFFQKTFIMLNISSDVIFEMFFFILNDVILDFYKKSYNNNFILIKKFFLLLNRLR